MNFNSSCIVTGTSTDVGKTVVSAILCTLLGYDYWKVIESGGDDRRTVEKLTHAHCFAPAFTFRAPLSPHHAAALENTHIDPDQLALPQSHSLVIEGSGGLLVPLNATCLLAEQLCTWNLPWIVASKHELGSINHTLLTLEWLRSRSQNVLGIVFNGQPYQEGEDAILSRTSAPLLGRLLPETKIDKRIIQWYATLWKETFRQSGILSPNGHSIPILSLS